MEYQQLLVARRGDLGFEKAHQRGYGVSLGAPYLDHRLGSRQKNQVQLPQSNSGTEKTGRCTPRRSQKASQCRDGQVVSQTRKSADTDARPKEAQQRRHQIREGGQMVTSAGCDAESKAQMYLSQSENATTRLTSGSETGAKGTGKADHAEGGKKVVLLKVVDARGTSRAMGKARGEETSQRGS